MPVSNDSRMNQNPPFRPWRVLEMLLPHERAFRDGYKYRLRIANAYYDPPEVSIWEVPNLKDERYDFSGLPVPPAIPDPDSYPDW